MDNTTPSGSQGSSFASNIKPVNPKPVVSNEPNINNIKTDNVSESSVNTGEVKTDYFGLKLRGIPDEDIWVLSNEETMTRKQQGMGPSSVVLDKEHSWNKFKDSIYKGDRALFDSQFEAVSKDYAAFKAKKEEDLYHAFNDKQMQDPRHSFGTLQGQLAVGKNLDYYSNQRTKFYTPKGYAHDSYGQLVAVKSQEQLAEELDFVYDPKLGQKVSKSDYWKKYISSTKDLLFSGMGNMPDMKPLVLDYDETGDITGEIGTPFWSIQSNEERLKGSAVRSLWGPASVRHNWATDFFGSAMNSFAFNIPSTIGSALANGGVGFIAGGDQILKSGIVNTSNIIPEWMKSAGNQMQNMSSQMYFKPSQRQLEGVDGQGWREVGGLVGMVAQAAVLKRVAAPAGMAIAESSGLSGYSAQIVGNRIAAGANHVFFAAMMADGLNQSSKEAGISEERAAAIYGLGFVASLALMGKGSKWFAPGEGIIWQNVFKNAEAKIVAERSFAPIFKESLANAVKSTGVEAAQQGSRTLINSSENSMMRILGNLSKPVKGIVNVAKGSKGPMLKHLVSSPIEFAMLHAVDNTITALSDYQYMQTNPDAVDNYKTTHEGLYHDPSKSTFEKITDGIGHSMLTGLAMGLHGGVGEYIATKNNPQALMQNRSLSDYVMAGKQDLIYNQLDNMHKASWFGDRNINSLTLKEYTAEDVDPTTGLRPESLNDVGYASAKKSLDQFINVYEASGIKEWHKNAKEKGKRYLKDYFDKEYSAVLDRVIDPTQIAKEAVEIMVRRNEINEELQKTDLTDADRVRLQNELTEKTDLIKNFEETVKYENTTKNKMISDIESSAVRKGMIAAHYFSSVDKDGMPSFDITQPKISGFKTQFGEYATAVSHEVVDNINKVAAKLLDPQTIANARIANNNELSAILEDVKSGLNSDLIGRMQSLHNEHIKFGVTGSSRPAYENMLNEITNSYNENETAITEEIAKKYNIDYDPEDEVAFDNVVSKASSENKDDFESVFRGKINALENTKSILDRMRVDSDSIFKKGDLTPRDILKSVYLSSNKSTADEPVLVSFDDMISIIEKSDFANPNDAAALSNIINDIVTNAEILNINKKVYSKLDNQVSKLTDEATPLDSDLDPLAKDGIYSELVNSFNRAAKLKMKAISISSQARKIFDTEFVSRDSNIRSFTAKRTINLISFTNPNASKEFNEAVDSALADISLSEQAFDNKEMMINKYNEIGKKIDLGTATPQEIEQHATIANDIADITNKIFGHVISAEHKLHKIFNSKEGEKAYNKVIDALTFQLTEGKTGTDVSQFGLGLKASQGAIKDSFNRHWYYGDANSFNNSLTSSNIGVRSYAYQVLVKGISNIRRLSPKEFMEKYNSYQEYKIKNDPNYVSLSFEQQKAVYEATAFLIDPSISGKKVSSKSAKAVSYLDNTISVLGFAGVGKTKIMLPAIMDIYQSIRKDALGGNYKHSNLIFTAPHSRQRENIKASVDKISIDSSNKEIVTLEDVLEGKVVKLSDASRDRVLVIDEASELSVSDVNKISEESKKKGFKVVNLIDESQIGSDEVSFAPALVSERTIPVTDVHRSGVYDIVRIQQAFREPYSDGKGGSYILYPTTQYSEVGDGYGNRGVRLRGNEFKSQNDQLNRFVEDLKKDKAEGKIGRTVFVVSRDKDRIELINSLSASGIDKSILEGSVRTMFGSETTAKGFQFDRVYVNIKNDFTDLIDYQKAMLTASSRAENFLDIITDAPENKVVSEKTDSLFTEKEDYVSASKEAYKEYAAKQPETIKNILSYVTEGVDLPKSKQEAPPTPQQPASQNPPTPSQSANNQSQQTQYNGSDPNSVTLSTEPVDTIEDYYDGHEQNGFVNSYFGKSAFDSDGNQFFVNGVKKDSVTGEVYLSVTDGVKEHLYKASDFDNVFKLNSDPIQSGLRSGSTKIESISDTGAGARSTGKDYSTLTKKIHNDNSLVNARVGTLYVEMHSDPAMQKKYDNEKNHFFQNYLYSISDRTIKYFDNFLRKIYINNLAMPGSSKKFENGIYHVVDTDGMDKSYFQQFFGTDNPTLVNGRYFIFSHEYNVEKQYAGLDVTSVPATEDPGDFFNRSFNTSNYSSDQIESFNINRNRFVDRVNAYRQLSSKGDNQVVDLDIININRVTNGNYVPSKQGKVTLISDITKTTKTVTTKAPVSTDAKDDIERGRQEELEALPFDEEAKQNLEYAKTKGKERYLRELKLQASNIAGRVDRSTGKSILIPSGIEIIEKHNAEDALSNPNSDIETRIMAIEKLADISKPFNEARKTSILISIDKIKSGDILSSRDLEIKKIYDAELAAPEGKETTSTVTVPKQKVNGWYPHEMDGKTVYFSDPYLIYNPEKQGISTDTVVKYLDKNGNAVFEPGYYMYYTLDPKGSRVGMIKIKSTEVSAKQAADFFKDYYRDLDKSRTDIKFQSNEYYDDVNRFIASNRYFFDQFNSGDSLFTIRKRSVSGKNYNNYEVQVLDPNTKEVNVDATYERLLKIADVIEKNYDEKTAPVKIRSFPSSNTTGKSKFTVDSHDKLFTDIENVHLPQVVVVTPKRATPSESSQNHRSGLGSEFSEYSGAEYSILQDEYQRDSEPNISGDPKNFVNSKQVNRDKKASEGIYNLNSVFGSQEGSSNVLNTVSKHIVERSYLSRQYNPMFSKDGTLDIYEAIESVYDSYKQEYEQIKDNQYKVSDPTSESDDVITKTPDELTYQDVVTSGSADVRKAYTLAQLARGNADFRDVYDPLIKKILPQLVLMTDAEARLKYGDTDTLEGISTKYDIAELTSQSSIATSVLREARNPIKGYSAQMKLILNSLDYRQYYRDAEGNMKSKASRIPMNPENVISSFNSIITNANFVAIGDSNFNKLKTAIRSSLDAFTPKVGQHATDQYNTLATLYYSFFHDSFENFGQYEASPLEGYSYYDWVKNADKIAERIYNESIGKDIPEDVDIEEAVAIKRNQANMALNEFFSVSSSGNVRSYQNDIYFPLDRTVRVQRPRRNTVSDIKDRIAKDMTSKLFEVFDGVSAVRESVKKFLNNTYVVDYTENGKPRSFNVTESEYARLEERQKNGEIENLKKTETRNVGYRVSQNGIFSVNSDGKLTEIVKRVSSKGEDVYLFANSGNMGEVNKNVRDILSFLGIGSNISGKTINTYLYNLSNRTAINGVYSEPLTYEVNQDTLARMLYNGMDALNRGFEESADLQSVNILGDQEGQNDELNLPIMEWKFRQDLAIVESFNRATSSNNFFVSPKGDKIHTVQNSSFFTDRFASSAAVSELNSSYASNFHKNFENEVRRSTPEYYINNPYYNISRDFAYNPLYNKESKEYDLIGMHISSGAKRGDSGKGVSQMSPYELIKSNIANYFTNLISVKKDGSATSRHSNYYEYTIAHPVAGDSSNIFYIDYRASKSSNSSPIIIKDGNVKLGQKPSAKTNWNYFNYSFVRELQKLRRDQIQSVDVFMSELQKFGDYLNEKGMGSYWSDPNISIALTGSAQTGNEGLFTKYRRNKADVLDDVTSIQNFLNTFVNSNPEIRQAFLDFAAQSKFLTENKHYKYGEIETTDGQKIKKIIVGNSVSYTMKDIKNNSQIEPIFDIDNYLRAQEIFRANGIDIDEALNQVYISGKNSFSNDKLNRELKQLFKGQFSSRMFAFIDYMYSEGVRPDEMTKPFFSYEVEVEGENNIEKSGFKSVVKSFSVEEWNALSKEEQSNYLSEYYLSKRLSNDSNYKFNEINPFYESLVLAYQNHSMHVTDVSIGDRSQYPSYADYAIRSYQITTPGLHYAIKDFGIGVKSIMKAVIYDDSKFQSINRLASMLGNAITDSTKSRDGLEFQPGIDGIIQQFSLGENIVKNPFGHKKEIHNMMNPATGARVMMKSSTMNMRPYRNLSEEIMNTERKMLSHQNFYDENGQLTNLWNKLVEFEMDDNKLVEWMFEGGMSKQVTFENGIVGDIRDGYISRLIPKSVAKTFSNAAMIDANVDSYTTDMSFDMDMSTRLYVLDLNKDAIDQESSHPTQAINTLIVGLNNNQRSTENMNAMAENAVRVSSKIAEMNDMSSIKSFVAEKTKVDVGNRFEILKNPTFGINLSGVSDSVRVAFANEFTSGIKPRVNSGSSNVQYPGEFVDMYELTGDVGPYKAGKRMTLPQSRKFSEKYPESKNLLVKSEDGLRAMKVYVNRDGNLVDIESFDYLKDILTPEQLAQHYVNVDGNMVMTSTPKLSPDQKSRIVSEVKGSQGKIEPYEVVMSFTNFSKFGLSNDPNSKYYYKNYDADDLLTLRLSDGKEIMYEDLGATPEERLTALSGLLNQLDYSLASDILISKGNIDLSKDGKIKDRFQLADGIANYMESFILTRDAFANRIPASKSSSASRIRIVGFDNDISNTILITSKKNVIDNSDYDIDEMHVYHIDVPELGEGLLPVSSSGEVAENYKSIFDSNPTNVIVRNAMDHYLDPENLSSITSPVTVEGLEIKLNNVLENIRKNSPANYSASIKFVNDIITNTRQFKSFNAGVETPGIFANGIKVYSHIYHAFSKVKGDHFNINILGDNYRRFFTIDPATGMDSGHLVMDTIANLLQAAVDNGKLDLLGRLSISPTTASSVIAMRMVGVPDEKIFSFLKNNHVGRIIKDIERGRNIDQKTRNPQKVAFSWKNTAESYKARISELNTALSETTDIDQKEKIVNEILTNMNNMSRAFGTKFWHIPRTADGSKEISLQEGNEVLSGISETDAIEERKVDPSIKYDFNRTIQWLADISNSATDVADVMALGNGISKLAKVFSVNQGIKFGEWDTYDYLENLNELYNADEYIKFYDRRAQKAEINGFSNVDSVEIPSEYDLAKREKDLFQSLINTKNLINKLPSIKSYIDSWVAFDAKMQDIQLIQSRTFRDIDKSFLNQIKKARFYNEDEYMSAVSARWKVISTMYLERLGSVSGLKNVEDVTVQEDVSTPQGQLDFILTTHNLIRDMKDNPKKYEKAPGTLVDSQGNILNAFIRDVMVEAKANQDEYINIRDLNRAGDDYTGLIKDSLNQIKDITGIDIAKRLTIYNIISDGGVIRKGSVMSIVDKDNLFDFDDFLTSMNMLLKGRNNFDGLSKNYIQNVKMRYGGDVADKLAVHMIASLPSNTRTPLTTRDYSLNISENESKELVYKGGIVPVYKTDFNPDAKDISEFPKFIKAWTPISGSKMKGGTKKYLGAFKLIEITDPEIVPNASKEAPAYRYVRIDNKVSDMLSGWTKNSVAQEVFGRNDEGRTLHIISMNKIKQLNIMRSVQVNPEEISNMYNNVGAKYANGNYYLKDGRVANLQKFTSNGKTGFRLKLIDSANYDGSEFSLYEPPTESADVVNFYEREDFIKSAMSADIKFYNKQLNSDYHSFNNQKSLLNHISNKSLNKPHALLADAMLKSASLNKLSIGSIKFISQIENPDFFKMKNGPSNIIEGIWRPIRNNEGVAIGYSIFINTDVVNNNHSVERVSLHEMNHAMTANVLQRYEANLPLTNNERVFSEYVTKLHGYVSGLTEKGNFNYQLKNTKEFVTEAFTNKDFQNHLLSLPAMNPEVAKLGIVDVWNEFVNIVKDLFFSGAGSQIERTKEMETVFDEIMTVSSMYLEGKPMFDVSIRDSYRVAKDKVSSQFMADDEYSIVNRTTIDSREELEEKYFGAGFKVENIKDSSDLVSAMVRTNVRRSTNDPSNENAVNALSNAIITGMSYRYTQSGKYEFTANGKVYSLQSLDNKNDINEIAREIISKRGEYEMKIKNQFLDLFNGNTPEFDKNLKDNIGWIKSKFAINPNDKVSLLSSSEEKSDIFDTETFNPFIIKSENQGVKYVSLIDMTTSNLNQRLSDPDKNAYIADFVSNFDPTAISTKNLRLLKTQEGMRKFKLMLLAMSMKAKDPSIVFEKLSVVKPDGFHSQSLDIMYSDYLQEMEFILKDRLIYDILSPELKQLVDNPDSFKVPKVNYVSSLLSMYHDVKQRYYNESMDNNKPMHSLVPVFDNMISLIQNKSRGHEIFSGDIERAIIRRINEIRDYYKNDEGRIVRNEEMKYLSDALLFIKSKGLKSSEKLSDIGDLEVFTALNYNIGNPVFDMYRNDVMSAIETGKNRYLSHMKEMNKLIKGITIKYAQGINGIIGEDAKYTLTDVGYKRFSRMFINQTATDNFGNSHKVNSYSIHHSKNPKTQEALKKYEISKEEVALGDYIVNSIREAIITKKMNDGLDEATAKKWYDANWKDGMIPVMERRASEKIFGKNFVQGLKQWAGKFSSTNKFFEYIQEDTKSAGQEFIDIFANQLGEGNFGSTNRMSKIGITEDSSSQNVKIIGSTKEEVEDSLNKNKSQVEQNLEVVMAYFMMNHYQKQEIDKINSTYYAAQTLMHNYEQKHTDSPDKGRLTNLRDYMRRTQKFNVLGHRQKIKGGIEVNTGSKIVKVGVDDGLRMLGAGTAMGILGGNVLADFKNLMTNTLTIQSFAVSNSLAGAKNFYGLGDVNKAIAKYSSNPRLALALSYQYKMAGMDRSNLLNNERHFSTKKYLLSDRMLYMGQFAGDYLIRTLSLMAHMNKKGVLDAYTVDKEGNLIYDETKDQRLYENGKLTEDGKLLKIELLKNMKAEGVYDGEISVDARLPRAFDNRLRESVKTITDKFITGGAYDDATALTLDAYSIGNMFTMFSKYLFDKAQNLYKKGYESSAIGDYVIKDVQVDDVTQKHVVFEGEYMEGLVQSLMGIYRETRKLSRDGEYSSLVDMWKKQDDIRKMNIMRAGHDGAIACMFLAILPALFNDDDDDHNNWWRAMMDSPVGKSMNYSMLDLVSQYSPGEYYTKLKEPFFAIGQMGKYSQFIAAACGMDVDQMDRTAEKAFGLYKTEQLITGNLSSGKSKK